MFDNYVFVIFCSIAIFVYLAIKKDCSRTKQFLGTAFIVVGSFMGVYCYPVANIDQLLLVVFYPITLCVVALFFMSSSLSDGENGEKKNPKVLTFVIVYLAQIFSLLIFFGFPWIHDTFTIENADAVLFTLQTSKEGAGMAIWNAVLSDVICPSLKVLILCWFLILVCLEVVYACKKNFAFSLLKKRVVVQYKARIRNCFYANVVLVCVLFAYAVMSIPVLFSSALDILRAYTRTDDVVSSELYNEHYVDPSLVSIKNPEKKNLIFIMLESMEENAMRYTPELQKIKKENISFSPGGESIATQTWTIGSQIAKYCGIPLKFPVYDSIKTFLPNAFCMQDLLEKKGYNQLFVQGTDKKFASLEYFFETHSNVKMHDYSYYTANKKAETVVGGWGLDDFTLFELMREDIIQLYKQKEKPFAIYAMTMDTHWPSGSVSEKCVSDDDYRKKDKREKYRKVLSCASQNVDNFLTWAKGQEWYDNTVIVIQGDHVQPKLSHLLDIDSLEHLYWYNVFINVRKPPALERNFSSFDVYPTIMEAMGLEIEGHKLGLGTSLFSTEKTLLEILGRSQLDSLLNLKDSMDLYFMGID